MRSKSPKLAYSFPNVAQAQDTRRLEPASNSVDALRVLRMVRELDRRVVRMLRIEAE